MIEILQETTEWKQPFKVANGVYHVNGAGHLVAYQAQGGNLVTFKNPMKGFSKSRRGFKKIGEYQEDLPKDAITVQGSNGKTYVIQDGKCTCPGFTFRGNCKHVNNK